jgi:hypothetical protein
MGEGIYPCPIIIAIAQAAEFRAVNDDMLACRWQCRASQVGFAGFHGFHKSGLPLLLTQRAFPPWRQLKVSTSRSIRHEMPRPDIGWLGGDLRLRLQVEIEVEFPSPALCQGESNPDGILQIGLRGDNLQVHGFTDRPVSGGVPGFVGPPLFVHAYACWAVCFFGCVTGENVALWDRLVNGVNTPCDNRSDPALN